MIKQYRFFSKITSQRIFVWEKKKV